MGDIIIILENKIMWVSLAAWITAQLAKILFHFLFTRKWDLSLLISSGGFPSSHTAIVSALAISVGKTEGWNSTLFAMAVALAIIVMYDAAGVRRAAGNHAKVLNNLIEWLREHQADRLAFTLEEKRLKELIGHTPFEVFGGAALGGALALIF
ncbi:MAG: divergent PAP2 family protein [Desulfitobacteriia bacterium]|jgi:acid phosphatase family membrane protein YuiD